jgi:hypothetical protein
MSTSPTPPPSAPTPPPPSFGSPIQMPGTMPIPGNAEFPVYLLAAVVVAIIVGVTDAVSWSDFVFSFTIITLAYLISRGIAKASRVYER